MGYVVAALYHFAPLPDRERWRADLRALGQARDVRGSLLLAEEGINGTIAGTREGIDAMLAAIRDIPGFAGIEHKESHATAMPFNRLKVRLKKEIVTLGQGGVDPTRRVGTYVDPGDWNDLIARDDVVLIDTRNDYEVALGRFEGAIDPQTASFREFPGWWKGHRHAFEGRKVAMYCTGGIRCEKASSWLLGQGVGEVFHLKGGILKYLEEVPQDDSRWQGECYVFDHRVSVRHGLQEGDYTLCHACGRPVSPEGRQHPDYEDGVSCAACIGEYSEARREGFRERQRQMVRATRDPVVSSANPTGNGRPDG